MPKPSIKEFMDAAGASFEVASEILYGVVGANSDTRNWTKIMSSADPVSEAKLATAKMYSSDSSSTNSKSVQSDENSKQVFQESNFAITMDNQSGSSTVYISDTSGNLLRSLSGDSNQINKTLDYFGLIPKDR